MSRERARSFVAVELPAGLRARLAAAVAELALPGARAVREENLHLTLRFLGEVERARLAPLAAALDAAVAPLPPFALRLSGLGAFPPRGRPRVLWAGVEESPALAALAARVRTATLDVPCADDKPFRAHVTVARFRDAPLLGDLEGRLARFAGELGSAPVAEVVLVESELGPRGPAYHPRHRAPLAGAP